MSPGKLCSTPVDEEVGRFHWIVAIKASDRIRSNEHGVGRLSRKGSENSGQAIVPDRAHSEATRPRTGYSRKATRNSESVRETERAKREKFLEAAGEDRERAAEVHAIGVEPCSDRS